MSNIDRLREITDVKIGCADNDMHSYSDNLNCCGVDLMPEAFSNWLKYNTMYIEITGDRDVWYPKCNVSSYVNGSMRIKGFRFKDYVDKHYSDQYGNPRQRRLF